MLTETTLLFILWRIILAILGLIILYTELLRAKDWMSGDDKGDPADWAVLWLMGPFWLLLLRAPWFGLSAWLLTMAIGLSSDHDTLVGRSAHSEIFGLIAVMRLIFLKITLFANNKDKLLGADADITLNGEIGRLLQDITPAQPGRVQLQNPIFKNDVMDCISDENMKAGELVKIKELDCGLPKIVRI